MRQNTDLNEVGYFAKISIMCLFLCVLFDTIFCTYINFSDMKTAFCKTFNIVFFPLIFAVLQ